MKKKIITIVSLIIVAIAVIAGIFAIAIYQNSKEEEEIIIGEKIIEPDRIIYRNTQGEYFEFLKRETKYEEIIELLIKSITSQEKDGQMLKDEDIDQIHLKNCIEFYYKTASKNYIIQLEKNENQAVIKLADTGGTVFTKKIKNVNSIKSKLEELSKGEKSYKLEYKEMISRNTLQYIEYKYIQQFKEIKFGTYQVQIKDMDQYERFKAMCNLAFDEEITEDIFNDNAVILTVSLLPKINVKVSVGNIKYTYDRLENIYGEYTAHLLIVSKIVNTDCIYNKDLTEIETQVKNDEWEVEYNKETENLEQEIFVTDFEEFIKEYQNASTSITEEQAKQIADKGFEEAERVVGRFEESTQEVTTRTVKPNNFFTRKISEGDKTYDAKIEVYVFTRVDDMDLNGVEIYVDKKLGKIIGGGAFGD